MKSFGKNESSTSSNLQILYHQTSKQFNYTKHESDLSAKVLRGFLSKEILKAKSRKISSLNLKERSYALLMVKTTQRNSSLQIPEPPASKANLKKSF